MTLYHKLFGHICRKPLEDGEGGMGGAADRGDTFAPTDDVGEKADSQESTDDDLKTALGKDGDDADDSDKGEQARDEKGKFVKKDKSEDEPRIPKSRYDEQIRKEREARELAERKLAEIEQQRQQVARGADITKLEEQVRELRTQERKALISGDDEKAAQLSEQADRLNRQIAIEQTRDMTAAAKEQAREEIRMELTIERIETEYPQLDEKSEEFDQELTDDVLDKQRGYMERERLSPSQALLKAVKYVMSRTKPVTEEKQETEKGGLSRADKGTDRKEAAVAKNLDAANRQPASTKKAGADSDKHGQTAPTPEAEQLTYEEFSALPDSTKAKMRGDFV